jgi:hypothetical protein
MLDRVRDALYRAMSPPADDSFAPLRVPKDLARRLNATLGRPLAPLDELVKRAQARERLAALRGGRAADATTAVETAPILVYFEKDRNVRELTRIEELLEGRGLRWRRLDVSGDEPTIDFVVRQAKCERDDLPIVFVADRVIGPYDALVAADVSGELARLVRAGGGTPGPTSEVPPLAHGDAGDPLSLGNGSR